MKYLPLVLGALLRKKWRTLLALLSLMAAFLLLGLGQAVNSLVEGGAEFLGVDRLITQARTSFTQPLPLRMLPRIEAVPGVKRVGWSQFFGGVYQDPRNFFPQFAVDPARLYDTYPEWRLDAEAKRDFIATRNGAIVGRVLADKYGWKVGDTIPLSSFIWQKRDGGNAWEWKLVGIFDGRDDAWQKRTGIMYLNFGYFDESRVAGAAGLAGVFVVRLRDPAEVDTVAAMIDAQFANSPDETKTQSEQAFQIGFLRQIGDIAFIVNAILGAAFFSLLILTGFIMNQSVRERVPEFGVLKCLGFSDRTVLGLVLAEALALCASGAALGIGLAYAVTALLPADYPARIDTRVLVIAAIAALLLAVVVGLPPAWRAMHLKIVDALAGR
ncbi:MAG TPA: ABC transporter permease [Pseudomonadota bacterium]|nr:ABC transporter permease [Xanthomonadales bacterium]HQW81835.1 ABC transporter permease [Pseudomonadota bacterium]